MLTVITKGLYNKPLKITLARVLQIIENQDPYVTTDWHIGRFINKKQNEIKYQQAVDKSNEMVARLKSAFKAKNTNNKPVLCLGDIAEEEATDSEHIRWLYDTFKTIPGYPKILIKGNNDIYDNNFYNTLGFAYVADKEIVSEKLRIIFTHEPISIKEKNLPVEDWINVHGHCHGSGELWNLQPEDAKCHLDVYHGLHNQGIQRLSWYLSNFRRYPQRYEANMVYKYGWS